MMEMVPKILLVDDEPLNLDYLEQELEDRDVQILTATNGREALDVVAKTEPDLILLDIMMPIMDGFEVLERLNAAPEWSNIPVIIISASDDMPSVVRGIELGADDFLPKPFDPVLLNARLNAGLEKKRLRDIELRYYKALERELEIGRQIQADFLPQEIPQPEGWQISAFFRAAREVAGDFYDVFELEDGNLGLLLGDVTDKGVGAALYMALFRSLLRAALQENSFVNGDPCENQLPLEERIKNSVKHVNNYICQVHNSEMFATLFLGVLDTKSGRLIYINAGHDYPYILREGVIESRIEPSGPAVGVIENVEYDTRNLILAPADTLVLYSDGVTDARNEADETFDQHRWTELLEQDESKPDGLLPRITNGVLDFIGEAPQYDDISLLIVERFE